MIAVSFTVSRITDEISPNASFCRRINGIVKRVRIL